MDFRYNSNHKTQATMNSKQATKALNELVSYKDQFDPQDWKDYLYDEAVSFQRQTKSKKPVEFLPEVWELIKGFMIVFPSEEEAEAKEMSGKDLTYTWGNSREAGFFVIGDYQFDDYTELHRDITYIVNGVSDPVQIKNFFWVDIVKTGMNWRRGEKVWFRVKQNVDDFFFPFASKTESEVCWDYCIDEEGFVLAKTARVTFTGQEEPIGHRYETRIIERVVSKLDCHYNNWWGRLTNRLPTQELVETTEIDTRN